MPCFNKNVFFIPIGSKYYTLSDTTKSFKNRWKCHIYFYCLQMYKNNCQYYILPANRTNYRGTCSIKATYSVGPI